MNSQRESLGPVNDRLKARLGVLVPTDDMMADAIVSLDSQEMHVYLGLDAIASHVLQTMARTGKPLFMHGTIN